MVVRFTWQTREWREAYLLASTEAGAGGGPVPVGYVMLGLTAMGGVGDLVRALGRNRATMLHDSLVPMLLLVGTLFLGVAASLGFLRRRGRLRGLPTVPQGEQQVTVHELGWAVREAAAPASPQVRSWSDLQGQRIGRRVLLLMARDGSTVGLPLRALTADQGGWLERLLLRKVPRIA